MGKEGIWWAWGKRDHNREDWLGLNNIKVGWDSIVTVQASGNMNENGLDCILESVDPRTHFQNKGPVG